MLESYAVRLRGCSSAGEPAHSLNIVPLCRCGDSPWYDSCCKGLTRFFCVDMRDFFSVLTRVSPLRACFGVA